MMISIKELGRMIRDKRSTEQLSLEIAAQQSGVSAATFWRVERAARQNSAIDPDSRTVSALVDWLGVPIDHVLNEPHRSGNAMRGTTSQSTPEVIRAHLRADRNLDANTADALAELFRTAYEQFSVKSMQSPDSNDSLEPLNLKEE